MWKGARRGTIALLAIGVSLTIVGLALVAHKILQAPGWPLRTDLQVYLMAADAIGRGANPYDLSQYGRDPYAYPPLFAEIILGLRTFLGETRAWIVWPAMMAASLIAAFWWMLRRFGQDLSYGWVALASGLLLIGYIPRADIFHGQPSMALLLLFVLGLVLFNRGKIAWGGLAWGLVFVVKPFLGAAIFFLARRGEWRALFASVAASAALFFLSFLPFGARAFDVFFGWIGASRWHSSLPSVAKPANQSFNGVLNRMFAENPFSTPWQVAPHVIPVLELGFLALAVIGIWFGVRGGRNARAGESPAAAQARTLLEFGLTMGLVLSCGLLMEPSHLVVALPGLVGALLLARAHWNAPPMLKWLWTATGAAWVLLYVSFMIPFQNKLIATHLWANLEGVEIVASAYHGALALGASGLAAFALWYTRRCAGQVVTP